MPTWHSLLNEVKARGSTFDVVRRERLKTLAERTGRNVIIYYSGWLQKPRLPGTQVTDADKNGFMTVIHGLDRTKGLDLILHTPGGETAATESLVVYLRAMFGQDIRAVVPELAMSAGTMIACACREIVMGKHSSLGPIDPQFGGMAAHGVVEEFNRAHAEIKADQTRAFVWQPIIAKYSPTLIGECEKAIQWSNEMAREWLVTGMLKDDRERDAKATRIVTELGDHALTKSHARHLSPPRCMEMGLVVRVLEDDQALQDAVLSVHHACILTLAGTGAFKIIENHEGVASLSVAQQVIVQGPSQVPLE
ncbi:S49 family peptidase [Candidatus Binatia bacterium]|nr:S49 family peptidase [Candidatus Binatia bacterium]